MTRSQHLNALGQPIGAPLTTRLPRPRPDGQTLTGRYCRLLRTDPDRDADGLFHAYSASQDARIWTYLPYGPFESPADLHRWMSATTRGDDPLFYTIQDTLGRPLGVATYLRIDPDAGSIEVGHINYSPALQRTPAATEAMYLMMRHAFDDLGYRRYEWKCDALNAGSMRAAERLGFSYEGTFRKCTHYKGRNRDTAWWAVLNDDWPARRAAFERWLEPSNFDNTGQQITPLGTA